MKKCFIYLFLGKESIYYLRVWDSNPNLENARLIVVFVKRMVYLAWLAKCAHVLAARLIVDNFDDNLLKINQKSKMLSPFIKLNLTFEIV